MLSAGISGIKLNVYIRQEVRSLKITFPRFPRSLTDVHEQKNKKEETFEPSSDSSCRLVGSGEASRLVGAGEAISADEEKMLLLSIMSVPVSLPSASVHRAKLFSLSRADDDANRARG
nr:hypothetical protein Iba_chr13fCG1740 [Ipomoea batatas]